MLESRISTFFCGIFETHHILKITVKLRLNGATQLQFAVVYRYKKGLSLCCLQIIIQPTSFSIVLVQELFILLLWLLSPNSYQKPTCLENRDSEWV